jgi:hypothetical protein
MKLGSKSNLISAYSALFTVAAGMLIFDYVRRTPVNAQPQVAETRTQETLIADAGKTGSQHVH